MTPEQQKALALARARQRAAQAGQSPAAAPAAPTGNDWQAPPRVEAQAADRAARAAAQATPPAAPQGWLEQLDGWASSFADGARQGVTTMLGAPVDLVNNAPRLLNVLPGVESFGPIAQDPFGGSASLDRALRTASGVVTAPVAAGLDAVLGTDLGGQLETGPMGLPMTPDFVPRTFGERVINRVGQEIGATAVPYAGAALYAAGRPVAEINRMAAAPRSLGEGIAAQFAQPVALAPAAAGARETAYAIGSGAGAGLANEFAGENAGFMSDMLGSLAGVGLTATGGALAGAAGNVLAGATGKQSFADDVANSAVAERIMNSSSGLQADAARLKELGLPLDNLSTDGLVQALRRQAPVEEAFPGYRANIAGRTRDPGLAVLAFNVDAGSPGAAAARRVTNEGIVDAGIRAMAPEGDPARFTQALQAGVDARIAGADAATDTARLAFDDITQALQPTLPTTSARGSLMRSALSDAYGAEQARVRGLYGQLDDPNTLLDPTGLVERAKGVDMNLAPNDAKRFRPIEADTIQEMMPGQRAPLRDTGLVNEFNRPIFAENAPGPANAGNLPAMPGEAIGRPGTTVPMSDITAIRTGLTDDLRAAQAAGNTQQARVLSRYVAAIDDFMETSVPEGMRKALDDARAARRDVGERFERPGTALESVLARREGGGFALDDSAVPGKFAQPDTGKLSDLQAALREAGGDARFRDGLADEVRADVTRRGLLNKPEALGKYMGERNVLLSEFPELRGQLEKAGATRADLTAAERAAAETRKTLTTPGRSAEASYLKDASDPAAAIRRVANSPDPEKAIADLAATAGSPQAKADLRAAFWEEVKRAGRMQADGMTGETRWNGKRLRALFDDPKLSKVAEELWRDDPEDLKNIKDAFSALASAEGSTRARAPGSSGTPQALTDKLDPALTAGSLASRARSVSRNVLSPTVAGVDILGTWLRKRSAQVQSRAIDQITAAMVNNPGLAADLLERYNPATAAARRRMLTQKYGVRITSVLNAMEEAENDDPLTEALQE